MSGILLFRRHVYLKVPQRGIEEGKREPKWQRGSQPVYSIPCARTERFYVY